VLQLDEAISSSSGSLSKPFGLWPIHSLKLIKQNFGRLSHHIHQKEQIREKILKTLKITHRH
jgi:hypothetical protein